MATFTKPTSIPRWSDTGGNVAEPPEAKKDAGWLFQEIPPSSFENWRTKLNGDWWKWVDERIADVAGDPDAIALLDPSGANADPIIEFDGKAALRTRMTFRDGVTESEIRVEKDDQSFAWRTGGTDRFFVDPNVVRTSEPLAVGAGAVAQDDGDCTIQNGLAVGSAENPGFGQAIFGTQISVGTDGVPAASYSEFSNGLRVGSPDDNPNTVGGGTMIAQIVACAAADFKMFRTPSEEERQIHFADLGGGPEDAMLEFDNVDEEFRFHINAAPLFFMENTGSFRATRLRTVGTNSDPITSRFEINTRNTIAMQCRVGPLGTVTGRSWNLDTVTRIGGIGSGNWEVAASQTLTDDAIPLCTPYTTNVGFHGASAVYDNVNNWVEVQLSTSAGAAGDTGFSLIVVGG